MAQKSAAVRDATMTAATNPAVDFLAANGGEGSAGVFGPKSRPKTEAAVSAHDRLCSRKRISAWQSRVC